ncbi:MAG: hypothetical protein V4580_10980 [Bacteroidota bacterium]
MERLLFTFSSCSFLEKEEPENQSARWRKLPLMPQKSSLLDLSTRWLNAYYVLPRNRIEKPANTITKYKARK